MNRLPIVVLGAACLLTVEVTMAQEKLKSTDPAVFENTLKVYQQADSWLAAQQLAALGEPDVVAKAYSEFVCWLYQRKQVAAMSAFGRAGIQFSLLEAKSLEETDRERAIQLKGTAKAIAYNVSANLWPGWNEAEIELTKSDVAVGLELARLNLCLGKELGRGLEPMGNAHWLVGAHELAVGEFEKARQSFQLAAADFTTAKKEDFQLMAEGYVALSAKAAKSEGGDRLFQQAIDRLRKHGTDDAKFFADQIQTAEKVFLGK